MTTIDQQMTGEVPLQRENRIREDRYQSRSGNYAPRDQSRRRQINNNSSSSQKKQLGECKFFNTYAGCHARGCGFLHLVIPGTSYCQFFNTPEGCRRQNNCGFIHALGAAPRSQGQSNSGDQGYQRYRRNDIKQVRSGSRNGELKSNHHGQNNNIINNDDGEVLNQARFKSLCHFFNSQQGCKLGDQCGFVHKVITPSVTVCHFFGTEKGCQAAKCGFIHVNQNQ